MSADLKARAEQAIEMLVAAGADDAWATAIQSRDVEFDYRDGALEKVKDTPLLRGFRQQFHWHKEPLYRFAPGPKQFDDPNVRKNIAKLAEYGLTFDLQVFPKQMKGAARLAAACPDTTFILQHAGMLTETTKAAWTEWREALATLAALPNVVTKLSAFGTFVQCPVFLIAM